MGYIVIVTNQLYSFLDTCSNQGLFADDIDFESMTIAYTNDMWNIKLSLKDAILYSMDVDLDEAIAQIIAEVEEHLETFLSDNLEIVDHGGLPMSDCTYSYVIYRPKPPVDRRSEHAGSADRHSMKRYILLTKMKGADLSVPEMHLSKADTVLATLYDITQ